MENQPSLPEHTTASPSPIAPISKSKALSIRVLFFLVGAAVLYAIFTNGHKTKSDPTPAPAAAPTSLTAPTLALSSHDIDRLKTAFQSMQPANSENQDNNDDAKLYKMRLLAPVMVYSQDAATSSANANTTGNTASSTHVLGGQQPNDPNSQFMANVSVTTPPIAYATRIAHPSTTLTQGSLLWATLETRIDSDLPGMVSAVVATDVYSEDDSTLLVPKGSRLIGQYSSGIAQGQNRIFVVWQRLIRPDHIDIQLNSPGTDPLGANGIGADSINYHFIQQFGTASLLSLIGAGAANAGVNPTDQYNSAASYRAAVSQSFSQSAQNSLQSTGTISPTLYINQGDKISVFVARDLDFYTELQSNSETI